jgi:hypothetical protein
MADDWDEDEDFDDEDDDEDDDEPTVACPYCKRQIHEDAQRCPYCEQYISAEDAPRSRKPWWVVAGVVLCLYIVFRWIVG